jgi:ribonuclease P/MRP protein subunit POP5
MVRFKNRYFLIELLPFKIQQSPDQKEQNRYHSSEIPSKNNETSELLPAFTPASVSTCIRNAVTLNYGQFANSSLLQSLSVKYSNNSTNMIILRVPRDFQEQIWASLTFITEWPAENQTIPQQFKCTWRSVHCAGTIRSCQKAAISYARKLLLQTFPNDKSLKQFDEEIIEPLAKKIKTIDP